MNAGIRSKARRTWPRGLEEVRLGYFRWMPPADVRHLMIRSLSLRLYHEQGVDAQAIAGHKNSSMTAVYRDVRGDEWIRVGMK